MRVNETVKTAECKAEGVMGQLYGFTVVCVPVNTCVTMSERSTPSPEVYVHSAHRHTHGNFENESERERL